MAFEGGKKGLALALDFDGAVVGMRVGFEGGWKRGEKRVNVRWMR